MDWETILETEVMGQLRIWDANLLDAFFSCFSFFHYLLYSSPLSLALGVLALRVHDGGKPEPPSGAVCLYLIVCNTALL